MYKLIQDLNHPIFTKSNGPKVSIYLNTHQVSTEVEQDIIAFKNALKTVEKELLSAHDKEVTKSLLNPLKELLEDKQFWHKNLKAIALFRSSEDLVIMRLNHPVKEVTIVSDSLHVKPLYKHMQSRGVFNVLTLDKNHFDFYTCTKDGCKKIDLPSDVDQTKEAVIGKLDVEGYLSYGAYSGADSHAMYHGHDDSKAIDEKDLDRFFSYIDHVILTVFSKDNKHPLILWALSEHQGRFRKLTKNNYLLEEGVHQSTKNLDENLVLEKTWPIMEKYYDNLLKPLIERYESLKEKNLASDNLHEIGKKILEKNI
ncbi:MAG: hypothetical protein ACOCUE_00340, partial [Candidatus Izemoplasmataceae bacterium]